MALPFGGFERLALCHSAKEGRQSLAMAGIKIMQLALLNKNSLVGTLGPFSAFDPSSLWPHRI